MTRARAKGMRIQRMLIKKLESEGWRVAKLEQSGKYTKQTDAYGLFDLIAIKENELVMLIQVTCQKPHTHTPYILFAERYIYTTVRQYVWFDRQGWKIFRYKNGDKDFIDERKKR